MQAAGSSYAAVIERLEQSWRGADHRVGREEAAIHSAHVDVPAFVLRRTLPGQVAHRGHSRLNVGRGGAHHEFTFERIDCDARVRHRTVAVRQPVDVILPQLTVGIVFIT